MGVDSAGSASKISSAGSSWSTSTFNLYYRLSDTDINRKWRFFVLQQVLYAIDEREDGVASTLLMNGERGKATSASASTIVDTDKGIKGSWAVNEWKDYYVGIRRGAGQGQWRLITATATNGTNTVTPDWDKNPDSTSDYIIYGGPAWQDVSPSSGDLIDGVVKSIVALGWKAYFAQGPDVNILVMQYDSSNSPPSHEFRDDGTNKADLIFRAQDVDSGPRIIRIINAVIGDQDTKWSTSDEKDWGANLAFGTDLKIHGGGNPVTNIITYDGQQYVIKTNGIFPVEDDRANEKLNLGLDFFISLNNGVAAIVHDGFLFLSWAHTIQRMIGSSFASVGPDRGKGLPSGRTGLPVAFAKHPAGIFACIDADTGTSSVLFYNDERLGWHELFRAWGAGKRVQGIQLQVNRGTRPKFWLSVNGDLVYQDWPQNTLNPLEDSGFNYQHEAYVTMGDYDMGTASLPKYFKELALITENLTTGIELHMEYQIDDDIGGTTWTQAGSVFQSKEEGVINIRRGNTKKIRVRVRILTNDADVPPIIKGMVLKAFARTPVKRQWNMRVKTGTNQRTHRHTPDHSPDAFIRWLHRVSGSADVVRMRAKWEIMDDIFVTVEPPSLMRRFANAIRKTWNGVVIITVREA